MLSNPAYKYDAQIKMPIETYLDPFKYLPLCSVFRRVADDTNGYGGCAATILSHKSEVTAPKYETRFLLFY